MFRFPSSCYQDYRDDALSLNLLSVCWQLYIEAADVLWRSNTWSFDDAYTFYVFLDKPEPSRKTTHLQNSHYRHLAMVPTSRVGPFLPHATFTKQLPKPPAFDNQYRLRRSAAHPELHKIHQRVFKRRVPRTRSPPPRHFQSFPR